MKEPGHTYGREYHAWYYDDTKQELELPARGNIGMETIGKLFEKGKSKAPRSRATLEGIKERSAIA